MAIGDLARLEVPIFIAGQTTQCVLGFRFNTLAANLALLTADFNTNMLASFLVPISTTASCAELVANDVVPGTAAPSVLTVSPPKTGTDGLNGPVLPPQDALVLSWKTALKGRSYRGRTFLPAMNQGRQSNGVWLAPALSGGGGVVTAMLARYGTFGASLDFSFVVISEFLNGLRRVTPVGTQVISGSVNTIVRSQRRRQFGVGQ